MKRTFLTLALLVSVALVGVAIAGDFTPFNATLPVTPAQSASVTNGQAVTVSNGFLILTGIGGANDTTNTVTLSNPGAVGQRLTVAVATASTNLITFADSGNMALSSAWLGDGNDTIDLVGLTTSLWLQVSESDN